jgi:hypothetical protein
MSYNYASHDKVAQITSQVNDVKGTMMNNIDLILARGEKLESVEQKASELKDQSLTFKQGATNVKRRFWCQNMKLTLVIIFIVLAVLAILIISICANGHC